MKKITFIILLFTIHSVADLLETVVSIVPEKTFVKAIGGDKVTVTTMVEAGDSPHTYEPKASQMISVAKAKLYFAIDVEFENVWLDKFKSLNPTMSIVDVAEGITKLSMGGSKPQHKHDEHHHKGEDPHIWTSPANVKIIITNIYNALVEKDPIHQEYYAKNLAHFLAKINALDKEIISILSHIEGEKNFMVFHPSWGYFAQAYHLRQIAIEVEGKEPKPKKLISLLKKAKEQKVKAIFTQPEFSDSVAKIIANELDIPVLKVSPLAPDWGENLIRIAKAIAGNQ